MSTKKYTDWRTWWNGLRTNLLKCIGTTGTAWLVSNGISASGVPGTSALGINWEQAGSFFLGHILFEIFTYVQKYQPEVVTITTDTQLLSKPASQDAQQKESK